MRNTSNKYSKSKKKKKKKDKKKINKRRKEGGKKCSSFRAGQVDDAQSGASYFRRAAFRVLSAPSQPYI